MAYIARKYKVTVLQAATGQWDWGAALTKLSQHYGTQLDDLFNTIDTDNSGHIDATELFAALIEAGQPITMKMIQALVCRNTVMALRLCIICCVIESFLLATCSYLVFLTHICMHAPPWLIVCFPAC